MQQKRAAIYNWMLLISLLNCLVTIQVHAQEHRHYQGHVGHAHEQIGQHRHEAINHQHHMHQPPVVKHQQTHSIQSNNSQPINAGNQFGNQHNHYSQTNIHTASTRNQQFVHNMNNAHWTQQIHGYQQQYHQHFYNNNIQRFNVYGHYWQNNHYHDWYGAWNRWGFYGGFWYPLQPYFAIESYFSYPVVQWFFVDEPVTTQYYSSYYASQSPPPSCVVRFPYKHVYFPTDTLRDLLVEVSAFPQGLRCNFRAAIINFSGQLRQQISHYFRVNFSLQQNDVVINYYQNLQNKAMVIAGFVNQGKINSAFEALLDLQNPNYSITFVPNGQTPTANQLQVLDRLNGRIMNLGGNPFTTAQQPKTTVIDSGGSTVTKQILPPGP